MSNDSAKKKTHRFGGRATASGVSYEERIAAYIATKMLSGSQCIVWEGVSGGDVSAITLQAPEKVDDIVVELRNDPAQRVFISAKERKGTIPLTQKSPAFTDAVGSFVAQFLQLTEEERTKCLFIWAIPSSSGRGASQNLPRVLEAHRLDAGDTSLLEFLNRQNQKERSALKSLVNVAQNSWRQHSEKGSFTEEELRRFLKLVSVETYDFKSGFHHERMAEDSIRSHIVENPHGASPVWKTLTNFFNIANQRGLRVTPASLRRVLTADGIKLKSPPDFSTDIFRLRDLTTRNLHRLKEHTLLPFGQKTADIVHIERSKELASLFAAVKTGHLLITGEPGCGKSGLIHSLVEVLQSEGFPVVLLLAEEVFGRDWKGAENLLSLTHSVDKVLANWPNGAKGFLITDALDAVRAVDTQKLLRSMLRDIQQGEAGWTVVASVRMFDLMHGRELREAFPGNGVSDHSLKDFSGVAHFYLTGLSEDLLNDLAEQHAEIRPFIENARKSPKSNSIHRLPFYLRLAAELLRDGVMPTRLADWNSPALLLRKFWEARIQSGEGSEVRGTALKKICRRMVDTRSMTLSVKEIALDHQELRALNEIRSRGVLQGPVLRHGVRVGDEEIRFIHHLFHDYAIARELIPSVGDRFWQFAIQEPLLPIFYRQSFIFALEELWDADNGRDTYWQSALRLEGEANLHGLVRILASMLAARRIETIEDLRPLLAAVAKTVSHGSPAQKSLLHLAAGLQDVSLDSIAAGAAGWCTFAEQLGGLLSNSSEIEQPLTHILARLNEVEDLLKEGQKLALNIAGRCLLTHHIRKEVSQGWRYAANVAIETICRTFHVAPRESEETLLALLGPNRLSNFPQYDLLDLANNLKHLGLEGGPVALSLLGAVFADEPAQGKWNDFGTAILPMRIQSSDQWGTIRYSLAEYYQANTVWDAELLTDAACITWNAVVRRRLNRKSKELTLLATIHFRGVDCPFEEDNCYRWGDGVFNDEDRILDHFQKLLSEWASGSGGNIQRLEKVCDRFACVNRNSPMWNVLMQTGSKHSLTLGNLLADLINEPLLLVHPDYTSGGTALFGALHRTGGTAIRKRLENIIIDLSKTDFQPLGSRYAASPQRVEYALKCLLGALEEPNLVSDEAHCMWKKMQQEKIQLQDISQESSVEETPHSHIFSAEEENELQGVSLKNPLNREMLHLCESLKPILPRKGNQINLPQIEQIWPAIYQSERALRRRANCNPEMKRELWVYLVGACESISCHADWPKEDERWLTFRRILLKAANDPLPKEDGDNEVKEDDSWPSYSWPAPRLEAAQGLLCIAGHFGKVDKNFASVLRRFCKDKSHALRFNFAKNLSRLNLSSPDLMWKLVDWIIINEKSFSVLEALTWSLNQLWDNEPEKVMARLMVITESAKKNAPTANHIHKTLAEIHLVRFIRYGNSESDNFISGLIADCDNQPACEALAEQLHGCRKWLTVGDSEKPDAQMDGCRKRTWSFLSKLLDSAQTKLLHHRSTFEKFYQQGHQDTAPMESVKEKINFTMRLVDSIAMQLYFASGAFKFINNTDRIGLSHGQFLRFWQEAEQLFSKLALEVHPHVAYHIIQAFHHLLPYAPQEVFLLAAKSIRSSSSVGLQNDHLAVKKVVKLVEQMLADHRELFQSMDGKENESLAALLEILDLFVEAGWAEARQLTYRLEEIYR